MELQCSQCHAVLATGNDAPLCPACGGAFVERSGLLSEAVPEALPQQVDHRGIVLPRRHALGGIITPQ